MANGAVNQKFLTVVSEIILKKNHSIKKNEMVFEKIIQLRIFSEDSSHRRMVDNRGQTHRHCFCALL